MKKNLIILPLVISSCFLGGCKKNKISKDPNTINVKAYKGGFGDTWLSRLKEKFETTYASEGYKLNIVNTSSTFEGETILGDMRVDNTGIDMYFVQNVRVDQVTDASYGTCALDLDDLYASKPVKYDRSEEDVTIADKLDDQLESIVKANGKYYGYLWANTPCGLIVNKKVLNDNGLSIPKTTNELFACYDTLVGKGIKPFAWGGSDAAGYAFYALYPMLGQLLGKEGYKQFMSLQDGDVATDNDYQNGYLKYDNMDIATCVRTVQKIYDTATATKDSYSKSNSEAHFDVMMGEAAFTFDGDFFYNEVKSYGDLINDIEFVSAPVISELGTKLQLDGSGTNETKCENILSSVIDALDSEKSVSEIKTLISTNYSVTLDDATIARIEEARNTNYQKLCSMAYIQKSTQKADICKALLRLASSDDFGHTFNETNNTAYPYCSTNNFGNNNFAKGIEKVMTKANAVVTCNLAQSGIRREANVPMFPTYDTQIIKTLVTEKKTAAEIKAAMLTNITGRWPTLMASIGH